MSAIGERNEVINATQVFLKLGGDTHILLQDLSFVIDPFETREDVAVGAIYFYSQHHNEFEATLLLSGPEIVTYLDKTSLEPDDFIVPENYQIEYFPETGTSRTINVTAMVPYLAFDKQPDGGVKARMRFRINEAVTGGDVT